MSKDFGPNDLILFILIDTQRAKIIKKRADNQLKGEENKLANTVEFVLLDDPTHCMPKAEKVGRVRCPCIT
jgi:hypothetical protein